MKRFKRSSVAGVSGSYLEHKSVLKQDFSRFYVMPALGHEFAGPGANSVDFLDKLETWVEQGTAPDGHAAAKVDESGTATRFERPVCELPAFPVYDGSGDPARAASFRCSVDR